MFVGAESSRRISEWLVVCEEAACVNVSGKCRFVDSREAEARHVDRDSN